jgi:hypothetical protein
MHSLLSYAAHFIFHSRPIFDHITHNILGAPKFTEQRSSTLLSSH